MADIQHWAISTIHSTDIQNSITKFCDLQDFFARFIIVAPNNKREQYKKVIGRIAYTTIRDRVSFCSYENISNQYGLMCKERMLEEQI